MEPRRLPAPAEARPPAPRGRRGMPTRSGTEPMPTSGDDGEAAAEPDGEKAGRVIRAQAAARRAVENVTDFTGRAAENVVSIESADGGWQVGVEVVETHGSRTRRMSLAIYEVCVDRGGHLVSYRRTRRYARGQLDRKCR